MFVILFHLFARLNYVTSLHSFIRQLAKVSKWVNEKDLGYNRFTFVLLTKQFKTKNEGKTNYERKKTMSLIGLVIVLVVVGVVLWLINSYIPMQSTIKKILNVVVVIVMILWLLSAFGLIESFEKIHI